MKTKYARSIIHQALESLVEDDRIMEHQKDIITQILSDITYDGQIRKRTIDNIKDSYPDAFKEDSK